MAEGKLKNLGGRISKAREKSEAVAEAVIATAEIQGAVFGASFAEGQFGAEKVDLGPADFGAEAKAWCSLPVRPRPRGQAPIIYWFGMSALRPGGLLRREL